MDHRIFTYVPIPMVLPFPAGLLAGGAAVCGGSVLRHLIGAERGHDIDVFCWSESRRNRIATWLESAGWVRTVDPKSSYTGGGGVYTRYLEQTIDLVYHNEWSSVDDAMSGFDIDVARVYTHQGIDFWAADEGAYDGVMAMEMRLTDKANVKTLPRLERYAAMGLRLVPR